MTHIGLSGFDAAIGFTVQQHLFAHEMTRARLGELLGVPGQSVSSRLRGKVRWTAGDLAVAAETFGVEIANLYPTRAADGSWVPAAYVPGAQKSPAPADAGEYFPDKARKASVWVRKFTKNFRPAAELLQNASDSLKIDFSNLLFNENDLINRSEFTQPAKEKYSKSNTASEKLQEVVGRTSEGSC